MTPISELSEYSAIPADSHIKQPNGVIQIDDLRTSALDSTEDYGVIEPFSSSATNPLLAAEDASILRDRDAGYDAFSSAPGTLTPGLLVAGRIIADMMHDKSLSNSAISALFEAMQRVHEATLQDGPDTYDLSEAAEWESEAA